MDFCCRSSKCTYCCWYICNFHRNLLHVVPRLTASKQKLIHKDNWNALNSFLCTFFEYDFIKFTWHDQIFMSTYKLFYAINVVTQHTVFLLAVRYITIQLFQFHWSYWALIVFCHPQGKGQQFHFKATVAQNRRQSHKVVLKYPTKIFPPKEAREKWPLMTSVLSCCVTSQNHTIVFGPIRDSH